MGCTGHRTQEPSSWVPRPAGHLSAQVLHTVGYPSSWVRTLPSPPQPGSPQPHPSARPGPWPITHPAWLPFTVSQDRLCSCSEPQQLAGTQWEVNGPSELLLRATCSQSQKSCIWASVIQPGLRGAPWHRGQAGRARGGCGRAVKQSRVGPEGKRRWVGQDRAAVQK